jgi:hypothetical protein
MKKYIAKTPIHHDGEIYTVGSPLSLADKHAASLLDLDAVELAPGQENVQADDTGNVPLEKRTIPQLKDYAKETFGLDVVSTKKDDILAEITAAEKAKQSNQQ